MSLVNQVLRDLDRRHAAAAELGGLPADVKPLPLPPRAGGLPWRGIAAATAAVIAAIAAGYHYLRPVVAVSPPETAVAVAVAPAPALSMPAGAPPVPVQAPPPASIPAVPASGAVPPPPTVAVARPAAAAPVKREAPAPVALKPAPTLRGDPAPRDAAADGPAAESAVQKTAAGSGRQEALAPGIEKSTRSATPRERADAEYRRGLAQLARGRAAEAIADLKAALAEDPGYAAVRQALAKLLIDERRLDEAAQVLADGLQRDEHQPGLALTLARIQIERGQLTTAAETLARSQPSAGFPDFRAFQGGVAQRLGRHRDAAEHYRAAVALAPQSGVWWMGLGLALEADGRAAEAREAFAQAVATGSLSQELGQFVEQKLR